MLTQLRFDPPQSPEIEGTPEEQVKRLAKHVEDFKRYVADYLGNLNAPGGLSIAGAHVSIPRGSIAAGVMPLSIDEEQNTGLMQTAASTLSLVVDGVDVLNLTEGTTSYAEMLRSRVDNSTEALPGVALQTDSNTGIHWGGGDSLSLVTGGTIRTTVDSAGKLTNTGPIDLSGASSGQIVFPATQNASANANTLDDYEEVTSWTPTPTPHGGAFTTATATGWHTKIGNICTFFLAVTITDAGTGTGTVNFALPYTPAADWVGGGVLTTSPFAGLTVSRSGSNGVILKADGTSAISTGAVLWVSASFRV